MQWNNNPPKSLCTVRLNSNILFPNSPHLGGLLQHLLHQLPLALRGRRQVDLEEADTLALEAVRARVKAGGQDDNL